MDVLDVCTGSGVLALCAARLGAGATAVDISRRAVLSAASDPQSTPRRLRAADLQASISDRVRIPFGPVMTRRPARLRVRGRLGALLKNLPAQPPPTHQGAEDG